MLFIQDFDCIVLVDFQYFIPEFPSLGKNSLFSEYKYAKNTRKYGFFDAKILIFIILKSTFCKKI
ncbi:hypothetical protein [Mesomycoplasma ovipneumoniae]